MDENTNGDTVTLPISVSEAPTPTESNGNGHSNGNVVTLPEELLPYTESRDALAQQRAQFRQLLQIVKAVRNGDFSVRFPATEGIASDIGEAFNDIIELNDNLAKELSRVSKVVGHEGKMTERVSIGSIKGSWSTAVDSVNSLI